MVASFLGNQLSSIKDWLKERHEAKWIVSAIAWLLFLLVLSFSPPTLQGKPSLGRKQKGRGKNTFQWTTILWALPGSPPHPQCRTRFEQLKRIKIQWGNTKVAVDVGLTVHDHTYVRFSSFLHPLPAQGGTAGGQGCPGSSSPCIAEPPRKTNHLTFRAGIFGVVTLQCLGLQGESIELWQ